jgi:hypothetical protein
MREYESKAGVVILWRCEGRNLRGLLVSEVSAGRFKKEVRRDEVSKPVSKREMKYCHSSAFFSRPEN